MNKSVRKYQDNLIKKKKWKCKVEEICFTNLKINPNKLF